VSSFDRGSTRNTLISLVLNFTTSSMEPRAEPAMHATTIHYTPAKAGSLGAHDHGKHAHGGSCARGGIPARQERVNTRVVVDRTKDKERNAGHTGRAMTGIRRSGLKAGSHVPSLAAMEENAPACSLVSSKNPGKEAIVDVDVVSTAPMVRCDSSRNHAVTPHHAKASHPPRIHT
jgi:hypothetical protein